MTMSGAELKSLFAKNAAHDRGILSPSGLRVRAHCQGGALQVELLRNDGRPIPDDAMLKIGTTDFLANGGDDFAQQVAARPPTFLDSEPLRDVVAADLTKRAAAGQRALRVDGWFDPAHPRIELPSPKPVVCK
jgi:hypothetical protein